MEKVLNYEELEAEYKKLQAHFNTNKSAILNPPKGLVGDSQVCETYHKVKPFLLIILSVPVIPGFIKEALKALMAVLDTLCPGS